METSPDQTFMNSNLKIYTKTFFELYVDEIFIESLTHIKMGTLLKK